MKKLLLLIVLGLVATVAFGQALQKGNLLRIHYLTVDLDPDVSMNQYLDYVKNFHLPNYEKQYQGTTTFLLKGVRGEQENGYAVLIHYNSMEDRDRYFNDDGSSTDEGSAIVEKIMPTWEELNKLGKTTTVSTEWLIL